MCAWSDSTLTSPPQTRKIEVKIIYCWAWWSYLQSQLLQRPIQEDGKSGFTRSEQWVHGQHGNSARLSPDKKNKGRCVAQWEWRCTPHHRKRHSVFQSSDTRQQLTRPFVTPLPYQHSLANYPVDFGHYPGCERCLVLWAVVTLPPWHLYWEAVLPLMKSSWFPLGSLYFLYFPRRLAEVTKTYCCFFWEFIVHCWFYIGVCLWSVLS